MAWIGALGAAIGAAGAVIAALIGIWGPDASNGREEADVNIVTPVDGDRDQPRSIAVSGTWANLRQGQVIWIANRYAESQRYFVGSSPCGKRDDGTFQCPPMEVGLPGDHGKMYEILALIADGEVKTKGLRTGAMVGDVVTVYRK